jgi:hypothetical protein
MRMKKILNIFAVTLLFTSSLFSQIFKETGDNGSLNLNSLVTSVSNLTISCASFPSSLGYNSSNRSSTDSDLILLKPVCSTTSSSNFNAVVITFQEGFITSDDGSFSSFFSNCLKNDELLLNKFIEEKFYRKNGAFDEEGVIEKIRNGKAERGRKELEKKYGFVKITDDILFYEIKKFNEARFKKYVENKENIKKMLIELDANIPKLGDKDFMDALLINIITYCKKTYGGDKYKSGIRWYVCTKLLPCHVLNIFLQFCLYCYLKFGVKEKTEFFKYWEHRSELDVPKPRLMCKYFGGEKYLENNN